jgi:cob(I)alamin adenosyltransferase
MECRGGIYSAQIRDGQPKVKQGLLIVYPGDGKGKTTAAYGALFRSLGHGFRAAVVQFIKGPWISGEVRALKKFGSRVDFYTCGRGFTWDTKDFKGDRKAARKGWRRCLSLFRAGRHDVYLFDELLYAVRFGFLSAREVIRGLNKRPPQAHVILTGRNAHPLIVSLADLVTEMKEKKHPFRAGLLAQKGIDF